MGGQFEYFGLWLDQSFDRGHSKAGTRGCTTYGSPQLSEHPDFEIDFVEVWAVGRKKREDGDEEDDDFEDEAKVCSFERRINTHKIGNEKCGKLCILHLLISHSIFHTMVQGIQCLSLSLSHSPSPPT